MWTIQQSLVDLWFDLWDFWKNKNWVDGLFWVNTFLSIIKLQKSLWISPTWLMETQLLKLLFPNVFVTLNLKDWRTVWETQNYVKDRVDDYNIRLEEIKKWVVEETKKQIKNFKEEEKIIINVEKKAEVVNDDKKHEEEEIIQDILKADKLQSLKLQKDSQESYIQRILEKIENLKDRVEDLEKLSLEAKDDWNPFNNDDYDFEIKSLNSEIDKLENTTLIEANTKLSKIEDDILDLQWDELEDSNENEWKVIEYSVKQWETIWGIVMSITWSELIAAMTKWISIFPWDEISFKSNEIAISWRTWDYKIDLNEWKWDFIPKVKIPTKLVSKIEKKDITKDKKKVEVKDDKKIEKVPNKIHVVKKWELLRKIMYNHFNDHKLANLFNHIKISVWDKITFKKDSVNIEWPKIDEVVLINTDLDTYVEDTSIITNFLELTETERFEKVTREWKWWYFIVDFSKSFDKKTAKILEMQLSLSDIVPSKFQYCEVLKDTEIKVWSRWRRKIAHKNYFDIVEVDEWNIESMFTWSKYKNTIVKDWYAIKPYNIDLYDVKETITPRDSLHKSVQDIYKNEVLIRQMYGEKISFYIDNFFKKNWSIIDEDLFYSLLKQESRFDPNALSHTWTRWLWMVTLSTAEWIIKYNNRLLKNEKFLKNNPWIEDLLNVDINSVTWDENFYSYKYKDSKWELKTWFKWVDTQFYSPLNSIKLSLSYLMNIESSLSFIKDPEFRKVSLLARYNAWTIVTKIVKDNPSVNTWPELKTELKKNLPIAKYKEVIWYVNIITKTA